MPVKVIAVLGMCGSVIHDNTNSADGACLKLASTGGGLMLITATLSEKALIMMGLTADPDFVGETVYTYHKLLIDRILVGFRDDVFSAIGRRTEGQKDRRTEGQRDRRTEGQKYRGDVAGTDG